MRSDFAWSICTKRFSEFSDIYDWDLFTTKVQLFEGDIIQLRFFKLDELSISQCYLEKVIRRNGDVEVYKAEANISHSFIMNNLVKDNPIFQSADNIIKRNKKINAILRG